MTNQDNIIELGRYSERDALSLSDYFVNPYTSCDFNCVYCYANVSPTLEKEQNTLPEKDLFFKFEQQLNEKARRKEFGFIAISPATDPYQGIERKKKRTKKLLSIIEHYHFPVHIMTKSTLVSRDLSLLTTINEKSELPSNLKQKLKHRTIITFSVSTMNDEITKLFEPKAPPPMKRFETMQKCSDGGLLTGIAISPVLPYISDTVNDLEMIIKQAKEFGAKYILYNTLLLFEHTKNQYYEILERHFSDFVSHYNTLFRIYEPIFDVPILRYHQPPKPLIATTLYTPSQDYESYIKSQIQQLCKDYKIKFGIL